MDSRLTQAIAAIANNTREGAVELAEQGADVLLRCARTDTSDTLEAFRNEVLTAGLQLIRAQPAMAPLVNLVNAVLWKIATLETLPETRNRVSDAARDFKRRLRMHEMAIAEAVLPLIHEQATILTNSRSTTVRAALLHAQRSGRHFQVICAEGRPGYEGRTLAQELATAGIPVTVVVDALAIARVPQASLVLIGADHLTIDGLANKVGTYAMALMAQTHTIPMYALCSSTKFLPPGYPMLAQDKRPGAQVWPDAPHPVGVENYYFDYTPLSALAGIVTERGVLPSAVIEGWLAAIQLHPGLKQAIDELPSSTFSGPADQPDPLAGTRSDR